MLISKEMYNKKLRDAIFYQGSRRDLEPVSEQLRIRLTKERCLMPVVLIFMSILVGGTYICYRHDDNAANMVGLVAMVLISAILILYTIKNLKNLREFESTGNCEIMRLHCDGMVKYPFYKMVLTRGLGAIFYFTTELGELVYAEESLTYTELYEGCYAIAVRYGKPFWGSFGKTQFILVYR